MECAKVTVEDIVRCMSIGMDETPPDGDFRARLNWIRAKYKKAIEHGERPDAYLIDWPSVFTPIESAAWQSIRHHGLPFLPQYPIGRYFADFADPDTKIVIECDGRAFHQDMEKDAARDRDMAASGWTVFRLTGRECRAPDMDWQEIIDIRHEREHEAADERINEWLMHSSDGVIAAIGVKYYGRHLKVDESFIKATLRAHARMVA